MQTGSVKPLKDKKYTGRKTAIVVGIDVGTTFSGISYSILRPNEVPEIQIVTRFSDQTEQAGRIPSVIYYDNAGIPKAIGAATTKTTVIRDAERQNWFKCEHFKMHFRPPGPELKTNGLRLGKLPDRKTAEKVMADFLKYLVDELQTYISQTHVTECDIWNEVKEEAIYVLGHPNGWSGRPQQRYRSAAVMAGLVPNTDKGHKRIKFVTEGEASALFCLSKGFEKNLKRGFRFVVADAGGGTIDISTFEVVDTSPLRLRECCEPRSCFAGSVIVNSRAEDYLREKLKNSKFDNDEDFSDIMGKFEATKMEFSGASEGLLKIGERRENDEQLEISGGYLTISREKMAQLFELSVSEAVNSIRNQYLLSGSDEKTTPIWLVGGFSRNESFQKELTRAVSRSRIQIPDEGQSKAVAYGAVLHFIDGPVVSRICPRTYGTHCLTDFDSSCERHQTRPDLVKCEKDGILIGPIFSMFAAKGSSIEVGKTITRRFTNRAFSRERAAQCSLNVLCYDGDLPAPYWFTENIEKFRPLCRVEADLSVLWDAVYYEPSVLRRILTPFDCRYVLPTFALELEFGTTEIEAKITWEEEGVKKEGEAKIVWLE